MAVIVAVTSIYALLFEVVDDNRGHWDQKYDIFGCHKLFRTAPIPRWERAELKPHQVRGGETEARETEQEQGPSAVEKKGEECDHEECQCKAYMRRCASVPEAGSRSLSSQRQQQKMQHLDGSCDQNTMRGRDRQERDET